MSIKDELKELAKKTVEDKQYEYNETMNRLEMKQRKLSETKSKKYQFISQAGGIMISVHQDQQLIK